MAEYLPTFNYGATDSVGNGGILHSQEMGKELAVSDSTSEIPLHADVAEASTDPIAALEAKRRFEVMKAMARVLTREASNEKELQEIVTDMSKEDIHQIAEERGLSGRCGFPMCPNSCNYKGKPRYKLQNQSGKMDFLDLMCYCSPACMAKVEFLAEQLGDPYDRLKDRGDLKAVAEILKKRPVSHGNPGEVSVPMKDIVQERDTSVPEGFADLMEAAQRMVSSPSISSSNCEQSSSKRSENSQTATCGRTRRKSESCRRQGALPVIEENDVSNEHETSQPHGVDCTGSGQEAARVAVEDSAAGTADVPDPVAPVLYFDFEDAVGPLEGDVGQKFGRLTLVDPAAPNEGVDGMPREDEASQTPAVSEVITERTHPDHQMAMEGLDDGESSESEDLENSTKGIPYLSLSPSNSKPPLSKFGRLYSVLDSMVTRDTIDWIHDADFRSRGVIRPAEDRAAIGFLSKFVRGGLSRAVDDFKLGGSRQSIEKAADFLVATFRCPRPVPTLSREEWTLFAIVLLEASSWKRVTGLKDLMLGSQQLTALLGRLDLSVDLFQALLGVVAQDRCI
ncbi:hypothetical protein BSKO_03986 [Bryopsis sp. KO-2023]|nr:hypothetical protein BSKO_03986 [Bryopsis sp. KO-2023]